MMNRIYFSHIIVLENYDDYHVTSFTDPSIALSYIRDFVDFDDLFVVLDIRMKNVNGLQLHQQIKSIDPTIKIIFITALDILDELSSIVPGISKEQMRKPIANKEFTSTVEN
jgi:DNA-binding NtrC family response regulator